MATFVLVHGSTQSARAWDLVSPILHAHGHRTVTPQLPPAARDWRFQDYASAIASAIDSPGAILVGHSASGTFLPLVPAVRDCRLLVFLAAMIPEPNRSVRDLMLEDPAMFSTSWLQAGPRWRNKVEHAALADEFLFHDCEPARLEWARSTLQLCDIQHLAAEPLPIPAYPRVPVASIVATGDRTLSPAWSRRMSARTLGVDPIELEAGHCPHVSRPADVAAILEQLAHVH